MQKVLNQPSDVGKRKFFDILDLNEDGKVCEKDLFNFLMRLDDRGLHKRMLPDIYKVLDHLRNIKKKLGKDDEVKLKLARVRSNIKTAITTNQVV